MRLFLFLSFSLSLSFCGGGKGEDATASSTVFAKEGRAEAGPGHRMQVHTAVAHSTLIKKRAIKKGYSGSVS